MKIREDKKKTVITGCWETPCMETTTINHHETSRHLLLCGLLYRPLLVCVTPRMEIIETIDTTLCRLVFAGFLFLLLQQHWRAWSIIKIIKIKE